MTEGWREIERKTNEELAKLPGNATRDQISEIVDQHVPDSWEWIDVQSMGGPPQIAITRCA